MALPSSLHSEGYFVPLSLHIVRPKWIKGKCDSAECYNWVNTGWSSTTVSNHNLRLWLVQWQCSACSLPPSFTPPLIKWPSYCFNKNKYLSQHLLITCITLPSVICPDNYGVLCSPKPVTFDIFLSRTPRYNFFQLCAPQGLLMYTSSYIQSII
jgi:hypothetical protein